MSACPRMDIPITDIKRRTKKPWAATLGALSLWSVLWAATFFSVLTGQERLRTSDLAEQFHAFAIFQAREWGAGRFPLWSSGSYAGFPFVADPQSGSFYIPRWITILLSPRGTLPYYALEVEALLHIWLAGLFTYMFAMQETKSRPAALLAAVAFGLGGYLVGYPVLQLATLETIVWLPLVLYCLRRLTDATSTPSRRRWAVATALALAVSCAAGHPQTFTYVVYLSVAYYFWRGGQASWPWRRRLGYGFVIALSAAALSAPTWLPAARYAAASTRGSVDYAFTSSGLPLLDFLQVILPNTLTLWVPQYGGMVALLLALLALFWGGSPARFWGITALLTGWLALGDSGVLFELAYRILPGATLFRQQERWLSLFTFAMVMLAAHGAAVLPKIPRRSMIRSLALAGSIFGVGVLILALGSSLRAEGWTSAVGRQLVILVISAGVLLLARRRPAIWPLLLFLLAGDLYLATRPGLGREAGEPSAFWPEPEWVSTLQESDSRVDTAGILWANFGEIYDLTDAGGISPLKPEGMEALESLPDERRWQLLGTTHIIGDSLPENVDGTALQVVDSIRPGVDATAGTLFALADPAPAAHVVFETFIEPDLSTALALLGSASFDPSRQVVLPSPVDLPDRTTAVDAAVQIVSEHPGRLVIAVDTPSAGVLVVNHWFFPGWRVSRNGEDVPLLAANHVQQGVAVPAGQSSIVFTYRPLELYVGGAMTILAILGAVALLMVVIRRPEWLPSMPQNWLAPSLKSDTWYRWLNFRGCRSILNAGWSKLRTVDKRTYLVFILLIAAALRLQTAATQDLRGDEAFSVAITNGPPETIIEAIVLSNDPHPPIHYFLVKGWRALGGSSPLALRMSSIWLSMLLLALTARLGFDLGGRKIGLIAAALMAISQSQIWIGHDVRNQYLLALCMTLWAALLLWRRRSWWLYGLAAALTVYSHYFGIFGLLAQGLFLLTTPDRRRDLGRWLAASAGAALLFLPWLVTMLRSTISTQLSESAVIDLGEHLVRVGSELAVGGALPGWSRRWLFLLVLGLAFWGARHWPGSDQRRRRGVGAWLLGWIGLATLGLFLIRLNRTIYNDFYAVVAAPALWLLVASGISTLIRAASKPEHRGARRVFQRLAPLAGLGMLFLLIGANALSVRNYFADTKTYGRDRGYRELATVLEAEAQPGDLILSHSPDPSLSYYLRDLPQNRDLQPAEFGMDEAAINSATEASVAPYPRIWFVPAQNGVRDPSNAVTRWLDYHLLHEQYYQFDSLALRAYRPISTTLAVAERMDARWVDAFNLGAVHITHNGQPIDFSAPLELYPGDELAVTLLWRAQGAVEENYVVFVHLLDDSGQLAGQHDGIPLFGTRPTFSWNRGEELLDRHTMTVNTIGKTTAQLVVGLYEAETAERLSTITGETTVSIFSQPIVIHPAED